MCSKQKGRVRYPSTGLGLVKQSSESGALNVPQLVLIGVGGIIGAGFFLGVGLPIQAAGPAVLFAFLIGAWITSHVAGALTSLVVNQPIKGSFMVYTKEYIGNYAGFVEGWGYYISSILVIASEAVAMSVFTEMWLPMVPGWLTTSVYALVVVLINALGTKKFSTVESFMSVVKIAALIGFILLLGLELTGLMRAGGATAGGAYAAGWFPKGITGLLQSMLIVIFAYAGIGVFGTAAIEMRNLKHIERAAWLMVGTLALLYIASIAMLLIVVPLRDIGTGSSPFVVALGRTGIPGAAQVLNGIILIASFSVMAGSVFSANQILQGLGNLKSSPAFVTREAKNGIPYAALAVTTAGIAVAIAISYVLPTSVYHFLISASSFFTFFNWFLILWSFLAWDRKANTTDSFVSKLAFGKPFATYAVMAVILLLAGYALSQRDQRFGFYAFGLILLAMSIVYWAAIGRRTKAT